MKCITLVDIVEIVKIVQLIRFNRRSRASKVVQVKSFKWSTSIERVVRRVVEVFADINAKSA